MVQEQSVRDLVAGDVFGNAVGSLLFDRVPPSTTMWLELNLDSYERSLCARHACRLWSRLIQVTLAALTICIATMRDGLFSCLGYAQDCHAKTAA